MLSLCCLAFAAGPPPRAAAIDVRGLMSACADGDLDMCRQLDHGDGELSTGSDRLDQRARAFARRSTELGLQQGSAPALRKAYPLIVRDYFAAETISEENRRRWLQPELLPACAQHYSDTWLNERNWWPLDSRGEPDWQLIYVHVLDHYFGYCVH